MKTQSLCPTRNPRLSLADIRTSPHEYVNPVDYRHPYASMARLAGLFDLQHGACLPCG